jgi:hypothetical protein
MTAKELRQIIREYDDNPNPAREYVMQDGRLVPDGNGDWKMTLEWTDEQVRRLQRRYNASQELARRVDLRTARRRRQARKIDKQTEARRGLSKKTQKFEMKNTTLWPTVLVNLVLDFVLSEIKRRGGRSRLYDLTLQHTNRGGHGHACASGCVHVAHNRERPRMDWKYVGISWASDNATKTGLQSLCHIIAHELTHTTELVKRERKNGRLKRQKFEFFTDNLAAEMVSEFAKQERKVWSKYRKHRRTQRNAALRKAKSAEARKTPDAKMDRAEMNLARWIAAEEKAKQHRAKWQKKVNRMRGARKAAGTRAANKS